MSGMRGAEPVVNSQEGDRESLLSQRSERTAGKFGGSSDSPSERELPESKSDDDREEEPHIEAPGYEMIESPSWSVEDNSNH